jgi:hypothetical protein
LCGSDLVLLLGSNFCKSKHYLIPFSVPTPNTVPGIFSELHEYEDKIRTICFTIRLASEGRMKNNTLLPTMKLPALDSGKQWERRANMVWVSWIKEPLSL